MYHYCIVQTTTTSCVVLLKVNGIYKLNKRFVCIVYSWTGNLVTNRTFEHFWLNEGFTIFSERKIIGALKGEKTRYITFYTFLETLYCVWGCHPYCYLILYFCMLSCVHRQFASIQGWGELQSCVDSMGENNPLTKLVWDLTGVDPDDAFSVIPYEKGNAFLYYLEDKIGGASKCFCCVIFFAHLRCMSVD